MTRQQILNLLQPVQEEHLKRAMELIDQEGVPQGRGSQKFDVVDHETGRKYPPPYLLELAYQQATGQDLPVGFFAKIKHGGPHFEKIESLGYKVLEKSDPLKAIIEKYKAYVRKTQMQDELYKWKLVDEFRGRPNTNATDFKQEILSIKFQNLIYAMALGVTRLIAKNRPEEFRSCFIDLFDESKPLDERLERFNSATLKVYRELDGKHGHHQDERTMATYLTFHNPDKYTFYMSSFYKPLCELMGVKQAGRFKKYGHYLELLNEFIEKYIKTDSELIELVRSYISDYYDGSNHLLLAQDILFTIVDRERNEEDAEMGPMSYWIYAPGENAVKWEEFYEDGIMALGWDQLGDLRNYETQEEIADRLREIEGTTGSKKNDAKANFQFVHSVKEGDIVFVKKGNTKLLGYGVVIGPCEFDEQRADYNNYRKVDWKLKGEWEAGHTLVQKTLTDITNYSTELEGYTHYYDRLFACMGVSIEKSGSGTKQLIREFLRVTSSNNLYFPSYLTKRYVASLATKPFVIFTGLSGSGKTKLAQTFAKWICESEDQFKIIPVGADWTNREPLLGYPNSLDSKNYVLPDNGALALVIDAINEAKGKEIKDCKPYFLILDEMNLSHVERYFADFLSAMESKEAISLYKGEIRTDSRGKEIPQQIVLPQNLFIVGTVNIDETTYMFSPKVLDRANTIEFRLDESDIRSFFSKETTTNPAPIDGEGSLFVSEFMELVALDSKRTTQDAAALLEFFGELQKLGAEYGYRTASEMLKLIQKLEAFELESDMKESALDVAVMQKLLPKLHGSRSKLVKVLPVLASFCIDDKELETAKVLLEKYKSERTLSEQENKKVLLPLAFTKIARMYTNAIENGFANYAEG